MSSRVVNGLHLSIPEKREKVEKSRSQRRQEGLIAFASAKPYTEVHACWWNPLSKRHNRLCGEDLLVIDDVQKELFNNALLSARDRQERLQYYTQIGDKKYKRK